MMRHKFFTLGILSVIVFIITIAFIFSGVWTPGDGTGAQVVVQVEDQKFTLRNYMDAYRNEFDRMKKQYPDEKDIEEKFNINERVLHSLIDRGVLISAAREAGIDATDVELQKIIVSNFQREGVFDERVYKQWLRRNGIKRMAFEASLRNDIIITRMTRMIGETAELSSNELQILESIKGGNQEQLQQVFMSSKTDQIIRAYIEAMKRKFDIRVNEDLIL